MRTPSLAWRVIALLAVAQLPVVFIVWAVSTITDVANVANDERGLDDMAIHRTAGLVAESLTEGPNGALRMEPSAALRAEMQRAPELHYAAFDPVRWTAIEGSSQDLVDALSGVARSRPSHLHFTVGDNSSGLHYGHLAFRDTRFGAVPVALYGQKYIWADIFGLIQIQPVWMFTSIVAGICVTAGAAWVAMRQGLKPLTEVVKEVESIELNSLHQRLSTSGVPVEIRGLVNVMNQALTRLNSGVERQRKFAANAAHELRTPLAVMRARLENAKASSLRNELLGDASQLRSIVEQMLVSARLAEGQVALDQCVDLDKTVQKLVSDLVPLAMDRDRSLDFEGAASPLIVCGNQRAIECVVSNLIDNALREEPKGGTVCVRTDTDGVVAVIDHGGGVASADCEKIFEPFWRKSDATSGSGLGLAIAKEIMDAHGGRIWVEATPGSGATFKLAFPKAASRDQSISKVGVDT